MLFVLGVRVSLGCVRIQYVCVCVCVCVCNCTSYCVSVRDGSRTHILHSSTSTDTPVYKDHHYCSHGSNYGGALGVLTPLIKTWTHPKEVKQQVGWVDTFIYRYYL